MQLDLARQILARLLDEGFTVDQRVPEQTIARALGVSRTPVRAALRLLAEQGVLRTEAERGFLVAQTIEGIDADGLIPRSPDQRVYEAMLSDRADGRIGVEVSEAEMMPRYNASRGVIRKVFIRLAAEGLAQRQRGHGWSFSDTLDSDQSLAESYRFRMAIECAALRQPGYQLDPDRILKLRRAHDAVLRNGRPSVDGVEWFAVNATFHETIVSGSQNRFFVQAVHQQNNLRRIQEYAGYPSLASDRIVQSCTEHIAILDALEAQDYPWAETLLSRHLQLALRYAQSGSDTAVEGAAD
ncbi:GntR family transcriptional regulator [Mesorhizobium kowhaii]|uniref:GntR family transcriptional regulator n=1 Tax=Mesorhizobium kowhaii TaxID=1300272 RepID=UPI00142E4C07|nr:GntR family transcriptional regulator [Mesorhizobium kowhaii]